jgi:hypothetical protein
LLVYCQRKVIIDSLLDFASYAFYYINIEVTYELLILEIIADNPSVDFGMPGELVYFVEQFYKNGYEELLIASVSEKPTPHNIWMLHRCYNDIDNPQHEKFAEVIKKLKNEEWDAGEKGLTLSAFEWEKDRKTLIYGQVDYMYGEALYKPEMKEGNPIRLYSLDEITEIFGKLGLRICNSFADFSGKPSSDNDIQLMVYSIRE